MNFTSTSIGFPFLSSDFTWIGWSNAFSCDKPISFILILSFASTGSSDAEKFLSWI